MHGSSIRKFRRIYIPQYDLFENCTNAISQISRNGLEYSADKRFEYP